MGKGKLTEHAQNLKGCEKCNLRKAVGMLSELAFPHIRCCLLAIPSDLMKSTAVDESLSSMNQQFCSRENQLLQMLQQNEKSTQIELRYISQIMNVKQL